MNAVEHDVVLDVRDVRTVIHSDGGVGKDVVAVDGVSLRLHRGETLGLVGESGSGKSVLGRSIMGLYRSGDAMTVSGTVLLQGRDVHALTLTELRDVWGREIGMVFQDPLTALNPVKRVGRHLTETLRRHQDVTRAQATARARDLLGLVGIPDPGRRLDQYPHELSGGMRQRVVIAMALANDPTVLIADEPTTALDVTVQRQILDLVGRLQDELGIAVLLISHNLGVVAGRADRVAVMYAGRIVETAPAAEVFVAPRHHYTAGLLAAIPSLRGRSHQRLLTIPGAPPDLSSLATGCRFAPRCGRVEPDCDVRPLLVSRAGHHVACHHPLTSDAGAEGVR